MTKQFPIYKVKMAPSKETLDVNIILGDVATKITRKLLLPKKSEKE